MKKLIITILVFFLFVPIMVNAEVCENDKVYIDSISIDKTNNVEEIDKATAEGKNIDLVLGMYNVGDYIRYKIVIKNDSNEDFIVNKDSINLKSKYVDYNIESDDNNIVKANSSKTIYLRINYSNQAPASAFSYGTVNDEITMKLNLQTGNLSNPNTGVKYLLFILLVLFIIIVTFIIYKKKRLSKVLMLIIGLSIIIPISVSALCKIDININSSVMISEKTIPKTIYRFNNRQVHTGDTFLMTAMAVFKKETNEMIGVVGEISKKECENEVNQAILEGFLEEGEYYCKLVTNDAMPLDYETDPSLLNSNYYIKDEIENNKVSKTQVCFVTDKEVCLTPGESTYEENINKLRNEEEWIQNHGGTCIFPIADEGGHCSGGGFQTIHVGKHDIATYVDNNNSNDGFSITIRCTATSCGHLTE